MRFLISFDDGSMDHIQDDLAAVSEASHKVVEEAKQAGVWIWGGGLQRQRASVVAVDGTVADGPFPETKAVVGGFSIIEVPTREEALDGRPKSPPPAGATKKSGKSCTIRNPDPITVHWLTRAKRLKPGTKRH